MTDQNTKETGNNDGMVTVGLAFGCFLLGLALLLGLLASCVFVARWAWTAGGA